MKEKSRTQVKRKGGLYVKRIIAKRLAVRKSAIRNVNPNKSEGRLVSIRLGVKVPQRIKDFMQRLTPEEKAKLNAKHVEVASQYNLQFNKGTLTILNHREPMDLETTRAIEYAVRTNINSMSSKHRKWFKKHWNGMVYMNIKKLVKAGTYLIPWHRDSHYMQLEAIRYKGFCVGAVYVNKPDLPGGNIQFAKNTHRFSIAPPSGTSVTFFDDEIFHRVIPVQAPVGMEYVPRSAFFMVFGTNEDGTFKIGLREENVPYRNYEKFYRKLHPSITAILNKNLNQFTNQNKAVMTQSAQAFFKRQNATYLNAKALYNNMKKTLGHGIYKNPAIKQILNKPSPLSNANKAVLNAFAVAYFNRPNATHRNVRTRYASLKKIFGNRGLGVVKGSTRFIAMAEKRLVNKILPLKKYKKAAKGRVSVIKVRMRPLERRKRTGIFRQ